MISPTITSACALILALGCAQPMMATGRGADPDADPPSAEQPEVSPEQEAAKADGEATVEAAAASYGRNTLAEGGEWFDLRIIRFGGRDRETGESLYRARLIHLELDPETEELIDRNADLGEDLFCEFFEGGEAQCEGPASTPDRLVEIELVNLAEGFAVEACEFDPGDRAHADCRYAENLEQRLAFAAKLPALVFEREMEDPDGNPQLEVWRLTPSDRGIYQLELCATYIDGEFCDQVGRTVFCEFDGDGLSYCRGDNVSPGAEVYGFRNLWVELEVTPLADGTYELLLSEASYNGNDRRVEVHEAPLGVYEFRTES